MKLCLLILCLLYSVAMNAIADDWIRDAYHEAAYMEKAALYSKAIVALQPVVNQYPRAYTINLKLGWLYYLHADYDKSTEAYRIATQAIPDSIEARLGLLLPLMAQTNWVQAEQTALQILKEDPLNYYANLRLIMTFMAQEKYELALRQAEKIITRYPADIKLLKQLALALNATGNSQRAEFIVKNIEILDPV